ncbi:MAG TPA: hypothetical protein ENI20_18930 [Bacteroides sp.]|nr:hypothetical protein [Bacteroides sp.]
MYKIERDPACYILTFSGSIRADEMQRWHNASKTTLIGETAPSFGVIINMKDLQPIDSETKTMTYG